MVMLPSLDLFSSLDATWPENVLAHQRKKIIGETNSLLFLTVQDKGTRANKTWEKRWKRKKHPPRRNDEIRAG